MRAYAGIPATGPVDRETARSLIHGYYACVSFTDASWTTARNLRSTGLDKNTIVVLWGDHGWQLGEHGMWNKHSCFETSMHAPAHSHTRHGGHRGRHTRLD
ncbi:MAG: sulfatase-like hydrolase/transferase [Pirellulaceae bacterium]